MNDPASAPPPDLERFRDYLRLLADVQLNPRLRVKEDASDIVQRTLLEAHRDLPAYRGRTDAELRGWLKTILSHKLINVAKHYAAQKRGAGPEVSLDEHFEQSSAGLRRQLAADGTSPSQRLQQHERAQQLADALLTLLDDERTAIVLKHFHDWTVAEIAMHLGRTSEAVAGLLRRGMKKLRLALTSEEEP
jgi:RNA polymerase sigma-70 factor (ECF subfamily)